MSAFQHEPTWMQSGVHGQGPAAWFGVDLPDGDRWPWLDVPIGSIYAYKPSETAAVVHYEKRGTEGRDDDWGVLGGVHVIQQRVELADFTDGGGATGTIVLTEKIPAGAWFLRSVLVDLDDFVGSSVVTYTVGDGTDPDRYNAGTPSLASSAAAQDAGAPSGTQIHTAEATITITVTDDSSFADLTAGGFTYRGYYLL